MNNLGPIFVALMRFLFPSIPLYLNPLYTTEKYILIFDSQSSEKEHDWSIRWNAGQQLDIKAKKIDVDCLKEVRFVLKMTSTEERRHPNTDKRIEAFVVGKRIEPKDWGISLKLNTIVRTKTNQDYRQNKYQLHIEFTRPRF